MNINLVLFSIKDFCINSTRIPFNYRNCSAQWDILADLELEQAKFFYSELSEIEGRLGKIIDPDLTALVPAFRLVLIKVRIQASSKNLYVYELYVYDDVILYEC